MQRWPSPHTPRQRHGGGATPSHVQVSCGMKRRGKPKGSRSKLAPSVSSVVAGGTTPRRMRGQSTVTTTTWVTGETTLASAARAHQGVGGPLAEQTSFLSAVAACQGYDGKKKRAHQCASRRQRMRRRTLARWPLSTQAILREKDRSK